MKSVYEVLQEKESTAQRIRSEIDALRLLVPFLGTEATDRRSGLSDNFGGCEPTRGTVASEIEALRIAGPLLVDEAEDLASKIRAMRIKTLTKNTKFKRVMNLVRTIRRCCS
jgi:hypothetical protein